MKTNKQQTVISLSFVLLFNSCVPVTQTLTKPIYSPPTQWETVNKKEIDYRNYYDNNLLDPIEGIWTYSEKTSWANILSGLRGNEENAGIYRIAVIKDENSDDSYKPFLFTPHA